MNTTAGRQQVTCLCLLDLSAAFDTINHCILLDRLSKWFELHGAVLNWVKSYLSNRLFRVKCSDQLSEPHHSSYGVPQDSALGPLLFSLYTTPLSGGRVTGPKGEGSVVRRVIGPKNHCELRGTASLKHWTYYQGHQHLGAVA